MCIYLCETKYVYYIYVCTGKNDVWVIYACMGEGRVRGSVQLVCEYM